MIKTKMNFKEGSKMRNFTAIGVLAALSVMIIVTAGCTTNTTNQTSTSTPSTAAPITTVSHDALLEQYVSQYYNTTREDANYTLKAWDVKWLNSTTVNLISSTENKTTQAVINENLTIMHFKSTDDATAYFNGLNSTGYTLYQNIYTGGPYQDVTGHAPVPYKEYVKELSVKQSSWLVLAGDIVIVGEDTSFLPPS
jgi:hypothetical protein